MGKTKSNRDSQTSGLGKAVTNSREKRRKEFLGRKDDDFSNQVTVEESLPLDAVLQSVTDETSLEEFLARARLENRNFEAERGAENAKIISTADNVLVGSSNLRDELGKLQNAYTKELKIPRRPDKSRWNTAEELENVEVDDYIQWRNDLAQLQEQEQLVLTPFERNLELWRQLWRVLERSDVVVQIVDARHPSLFRSTDLEEYVREIGPNKRNLLLLNKADFLSVGQMESWRHYFQEEGLEAIFWSAVAPDSVPVGDESDSEPTVFVDDDSETCSDGQDDEGKEVVDESQKTAQTAAAYSPILSTEQLIQYLKLLGSKSLQPSESRPPVIGMVGYPNVGKSSTINKLLGRKKLAVSATPGKTRHLQTIVFDEQLVFCDCPGLVMPSFALNKEEMVLNGILPIDQLRDCLPAVTLLCERFPREILQRKYGLILKSGENDGRSLAQEFLTSLAFLRGFMSAKGVPDSSRSGRLVLKDVVGGKLVWCSAPPGVGQVKGPKPNSEEFNESVVSRNSKPSKGQAVFDQLEKRKLFHANAGVKERELDVTFFRTNNSTVHQKGGNRRDYDSKSEKKHFNRKKKDKLRRVFANLDA